MQDLVGDLIVKTLPGENEVVLGRSVDAYSVVDDPSNGGVNAVYSLRTRKASDVEGLWVTELPEF